MSSSAADGPPVEIRRSARRRRTVSAHREGDTIVVLVPDRLTPRQEQQWAQRMVRDVVAREARQRCGGPRRSDQALLERAERLTARYLEGRAHAASVQWVDTMNRRWGSCTTLDRSIRLSRRLAPMPDWVIDYVLMHELVHLLVPGHDAQFWALVGRYPRTERARGYLDGVSTAANLGIADPD